MTSFVVVTASHPAKIEGAYLVCDWDAFIAFTSHVVPDEPFALQGEENAHGEYEYSIDECRLLADQIERGNEKAPHWAKMLNVNVPAWLTFLRNCSGFKVYCWSDDIGDSGREDEPEPPIKPDDAVPFRKYFEKVA